jgi:iron complex transport system ATP-binding protein
LLLKKLAKEQQKTILFSTHDLSVALKASDRMWVMCEGQMHQGAPQQLMTAGVFDQLLQNTRLTVDHHTGEVRLAGSW